MPAPDSPRRLMARHWIAPLLVFLAALVVYAPTASRDVTSTDVVGVALESWTIATTGQPWLDDFDFDSFAEHPEAEKGATWATLTAGGHLVVTRSPGVVLVGIPGYWLGSHDQVSLVPQALTAAVLGALSAMLFYLALVRRMGNVAALTATAVFALMTPMWSVAANSLWTHSVTTLGIVGMAWASDRRKWWLVGLFGGIALWGRVHTALIVAILGLGVAAQRRRPGVAVAIGLVSGVAMGLATLWTRWVYEIWSPSGGYNAEGYLQRVQTGFTESWTGRLSNELGLWVSADRGILVWTPILLLLLPALLRSWRTLPDWSRYLLLGGVVYTLFQGWFSGFHGGDAFYAYRLGLEFLACASPAFAFAAVNMGRWAKRLIGPVLGLQFGAIMLGSINERLFVPETEAWTTNAAVAAIAGNPAAWVLPVLFVVIGVLAHKAWRDRYGVRAGAGVESSTDSAREESQQGR